VPHRRKLLAFVGLSCADLVLTWALLRRDSACVYEANPLASWWLDQFGILGLGVFKCATLFVAIVAIVLLIGRRPRLAGGVLWFGCAAVGGVVLYSCSLGGYLEAALAEQADLEAPIPIPLSYENYLRLRAQVVADLVERRCSLAEAVRELEPVIQEQSPTTLEFLAAQYPDLSTDELVAVSLLSHAVTFPQEPEQFQRVMSGLRTEYVSAFHQEPPCELRPPAAETASAIGLQ
jgi:hypothetical protein